MSLNQPLDQARKERAIDLINQGRLEEARELVSELCREDQGDIEIWSLNMTANGYLGRFEDVIQACHKMLEIEADHLLAMNGLASALAALGRYDEAVVQFASLLSLAPGSPEILCNYGHALFLMGRVEEARAALEEAVRIQPHYAQARYNLATLLEQSGLEADAMREYEMAATLKPGLPEIDARMNRLRNRGVTSGS